MTDSVNPVVLRDERSALYPPVDLAPPDSGTEQLLSSDQALALAGQAGQKSVDLTTHTVV
jgi:hypothetical protein